MATVPDAAAALRELVLAVAPLMPPEATACFAEPKARAAREVWLQSLSCLDLPEAAARRLAVERRKPA